MSACIFVLLAVSFSAGVSKAAGSSDISAIRVYVHSRYLLDRAMADGVSPAQEAVKRYVAQVAQECPNVLVGVPRGEQSLEFVQEEIDAFGAIFARVVKTRLINDERILRKLRSSARKLDHTALRGAVATLPNFHVPMPSLCRDFKAWAATGFKTLPSATRKLASIDHAPPRETSESPKPQDTLNNPDRLTWLRLAPYESASLNKVAMRTQKLEGRFATALVETLLSASVELDGLLGMTIEAPEPRPTGKVVAPTTSG
ncbi:MAG TPA: hypothetical protein VG188_09365 [Solirubrobacteraceae bacterium]|jgi:hypothetical protein|nr:hypothetical protein [Solirubrobacteraceae bacterium]